MYQLLVTQSYIILHGSDESGDRSKDPSKIELKTSWAPKLINYASGCGYGSVFNFLEILLGRTFYGMGVNSPYPYLVLCADAVTDVVYDDGDNSHHDSDEC